MKPFDLSGRVAIVTGGNGGIGFGMAEGLAEAGAAIVVAARNREKSEAAVARLAASGAASAFIPLDVADPESCREMVRRAVERFGRLDILVNNAGMSIRKPPQDYAVAEWHTVLDTNLTGPLVCCQAAYPVMKAAGRRQDHQYRVDDVDLRRRLCRGLFRQQGGDRAADPVARDRLGQGQHPGQRGIAGLDRHRADDRGAPTGRGPATSASCAAPRPGAGACRPTWPASPCSSPPRPPIS